MAVKQIFDTTSRWVNIYQLNEVISGIYDLIDEGGGTGSVSKYWGEPVQTFADLPAGKDKGYVCLVMDDLTLYVFDGTKYVASEVKIDVATTQDIIDMFD